MRRSWGWVVLVLLVPTFVQAEEPSEVPSTHQVFLDSLLVVAVKGAALDSVKSLLSQGAKPSAKDPSGQTAFMYAAERCNLDVATVMHGGTGAVQEIRKSKLSMWGTGRIYDEIVLAMLSRGVAQKPPVKAGDDRALLTAAVYGQADRIPALLEAGANVNARSKGRSALIWAAFWGHTEAVRRLLEGGADLDMKDETGSTALFWANQLGHKEAARLIREEADRRRTAREDSLRQAESTRGR